MKEYWKEDDKIPVWTNSTHGAKSAPRLFQAPTEDYVDSDDVTRFCICCMQQFNITRGFRKTKHGQILCLMSYCNIADSTKYRVYPKRMKQSASKKQEADPEVEPAPFTGYTSSEDIPPENKRGYTHIGNG